MHKLYDEASVQAIAQAIREKNGGTATYKIADMPNAIRAIETQGKIIPTYHYVEALEVAEKISDFKKVHPNNLVFGAISDNHVLANDATYEELSKASVRHGAFALETVGTMVECDFVTNLGDNCWENGSDTDNAYQGNVTSSNSAVAIVEGDPYQTQLSVGKDYAIDAVTVTMGGVDITATVYNSSNGLITIAEVTGDIVITATAIENYVPHWDIADRTPVTSRLLATDTKEISRHNYYVGAASTGAMYDSYVTDVSLNGNDVTFTSTSQAVGVALPYHLESGASYNFACTASQTARLRVYVLNADGTFVDGSESYSSSGTNLSHDFTAPTDKTKWTMLLLDVRTTGNTTTFSNISLTKN